MSVPRVVVVGDLIYDLLAKVDALALGTDTFTTIHAEAGGSGANTAYWLARLGVETHFVGRVGDDVFGQYLIEELDRGGVVPHVVEEPAYRTGKVFVMVDGEGERTMITDRGAGETLSPHDLPADLFEKGAHLHLSGYLFLGNSRKETALEALRMARDTGMSVSVDPSSVPLLQRLGPEQFLEWTEDAELCFPNREEGALLSGAEDPGSAAEALVRSYNGVVLKLGADGALYANPDGEQIRLPAVPARVVDATGAGDALCAGFLAAWLGKRPPLAALRKGLELSARVLQTMGSRPRK
ncbi:MAG: sugar kinase [Actinomycetota bacterium]|nr:sugar kinase [Actinomycetota bacterium]